MDCTITGAKYVKKAQDVVDIISSGGQIDCSEIKELFDELYTLLRDGKNCTAIQTAVQAAGFDSVEELISDYELLLADKGC